MFMATRPVATPAVAGGDQQLTLRDESKLGEQVEVTRPSTCYPR